MNGERGAALSISAIIMPSMTIFDADGPRLVDVQEIMTGAQGMIFWLSITVGRKNLSSECERIRFIKRGGNRSSAIISYYI